MACSGSGQGPLFWGHAGQHTGRLLAEALFTREETSYQDTFVDHSMSPRRKQSTGLRPQIFVEAQPHLHPLILFLFPSGESLLALVG